MFAGFGLARLRPTTMEKKDQELKDMRIVDTAIPRGNVRGLERPPTRVSTRETQRRCWRLSGFCARRARHLLPSASRAISARGSQPLFFFCHGEEKQIRGESTAYKGGIILEAQIAQACVGYARRSA